MSKPAAPILPGTTIGVFGSGQLGRMMALAARSMGYGIVVFSPEASSPTGRIADREIVADYADADAVRAFVRGVHVVTFEFENVPASVAEIAQAEGVPVRPGGHVLHTAQQRGREKGFLRAAGIPVTPFAVVKSVEDLSTAAMQIGLPAVLKTTAFGYDGKGQALVHTYADIPAAWAALATSEAILEKWVDFSHELSVVAARASDGAFVHYGVLENHHTDHILDVTVAPARIPAHIAGQAVALAQEVLHALDVVGVLCVEFFLTRDETLLVNELAPRPHNSGHLTIDAAVTSQFEQQVRAVCGLPLGSTELLRPAAMANLLGDLWRDGEPDWAAACADPSIKLHLYGKRAARPGRKMGHLTALASDGDQAERLVMAARSRLTPIPVVPTRTT